MCLNSNILNLYPEELSGGMQKRVAIARTLSYQPNIIFFDEPTTGLDPISANDINNLILKVKKDLGATIITITHDIRTIKTLSDRIIMLDKGSVIWEGKSIDNMKDIQYKY